MVMNFFKRLSVLLALGWSAATWAQGTYPQQKVTLTVPFPAGGIADLSARALKPSLDKALGQPVTIVNRPGASGAIGAAAVANATADGYTLMYTLSSVASVPAQAVLFAAALKANPKVETVGKSSAGEIADLDGSELETFWKADLARTSVTIQRNGRIQ